MIEFFKKIFGAKSTETPAPYKVEAPKLAEERLTATLKSSANGIFGTAIRALLLLPLSSTALSLEQVSSSRVWVAIVSIATLRLYCAKLSIVRSLIEQVALLIKVCAPA